MSYSVFFRESKKVFTAETFIHQQPETHQNLLRSIVETLALNGQITHPQVSKSSNGDWSVLIKEDNGDVYLYTIFISQFEQERPKEEVQLQSKKELVIIDLSGPRDSVGGYHPGYWTVAQYAALLDEQKRDLFLQTIDQIQRGVLSESYSLNADRSISIHVEKLGKAYAIGLSCRAEWK